MQPLFELVMCTKLGLGFSIGYVHEVGVGIGV